MEKSKSHRFRRPGRWIFIACVGIALVILGLTARDQSRRAEMSIGTALTIDTASSFTTAIINRKSFVPPSHGFPSSAQIGFALRIARIDSVFRREGVAQQVRSKTLAREFNQSMMSIAEYRWISTTIVGHYTANALHDAPFHQGMEERLRMVEDLLMRATGRDMRRLSAVIDELGAPAS